MPLSFSIAQNPEKSRVSCTNCRIFRDFSGFSQDFAAGKGKTHYRPPKEIFGNGRERLSEKKFSLYNMYGFSVKSPNSCHACMTVDEKLYDMPGNEEGVGRGPADSEFPGGLWERCARNNP